MAALRAERDTAIKNEKNAIALAYQYRAEVERMRPVVDEACRWRDEYHTPNGADDADLIYRVDAYRATSEQYDGPAGYHMHEATSEQEGE